LPAIVNSIESCCVTNKAEQYLFSLACLLLVAFLFMEYSVEDLPQDCLDAASLPLNFQTRNARFRQAVCQHYQLQWKSVSGHGNCFFEAVCVLLRDPRIHHEFDSDELRANVIEFFRSCLDSTQLVCERVKDDMLAEVNQALSCSSHKSFNGKRLNGYIPTTIEEYLDASSHDGVWVQGTHWLRAISFLFDVRVAVIIYGQPIARFFGSGPITIYLYKVDAETHWDALVSMVGAAAAKDYAYFVHALFVNCAQCFGASRTFVQHVIRHNFDCTCKSWIALSPLERDILYDKAIKALRTVLKFRDESVQDLTNEIEKSHDANAKLFMAKDLEHLLDPKLSSEEELCDITSSSSDNSSSHVPSSGGGGGAGECTLTLKRALSNLAPLSHHAQAHLQWTLLPSRPPV
jgi:hypothetical protein